MTGCGLWSTVLGGTQVLPDYQGALARRHGMQGNGCGSFELLRSASVQICDADVDSRLPGVSAEFYGSVAHGVMGSRLRRVREHPTGLEEFMEELN
eukprot:5880517-Prymnesium_polylepis.1